MPERHLRQPGLTYGTCGPFTKKEVRIQKIEGNRRFNICLSKRTR